jgi:hypothetical protein
MILIDKCLARTPDTELDMLQNTHEILCESRVMYGVELWDLMRHGRNLTQFKVDSARNCLGLQRCAANGIVACTAVAMQRPRDARIYQGRFRLTAL